MPTPRVAYVEDNDAMRYATSRILREGGFDVQEAHTGAEALALTRTAPPPDLVLLDVRLPDMSGFEVCRRIKEDPLTASIPVLHLSSTYGASDYVAQGLDGGADGYLTHPADPRVLLATIRALLRARSAEAQLRAANQRLEEALSDVQRAEADRMVLLVREAAARRSAEQANVLKDQFLATLSHELRTPLNAILGWTHVLRNASDDAGVRERAVEVIARNAHLQARMIEEILDVSRIVSGTLSLAVKELDWAGMVEAAVESVRPQAAGRGIELDVVVACPPGEAEGDAERLQQVVWNLLTNAVKFSQGGRIELRLDADAERVVLSVRDEGIGIEPEFLPHVFERFRQADSTPARSQAGLGLGLTIVRHIVEAHGGTVAAYSDGAGRGACFTVSIPRRIPDGPRAEAVGAALAPATPAAEGSLRGRRVLVIENDSDSRELLEAVLVQRGMCVSGAASAAEARVVLAHLEPDVIVCDVGMPGEDGLAFVRWVRSQPALRGVPVLALTAYAADADRDKGLAAGFDAYLTKPFELPELIDHLSAAMAAAHRATTATS
jgi:signal transduction histidine kinase